MTETAAPPAQTQTPKHLGVALLVISVAQLMVILDATIVNIALEKILEADLGFTTESLQWVVTSYTLAFGGLLLLGGRMGDILGRRRVFISGIWLFVLASFLGGLAQSEGQLIAARVLQGIGAALASPAALALIATEFPEGAPRNRALGVFAAMSGVGASIGLILGGVLTDGPGWRWVMFVNVPIGAFAALLAPRVLHESPRHSGKFDLPGAITASLGLALLVYGFSRAATEGWSDAITVASLALASALLLAFVYIEWKSPHALMPLRVWADRTRAGSYIIALIIGAALFALFYFLTLFVQIILDYSPLKAGFAFLPVSVTIIVSAGIAAALLNRMAARPIILAGLTITTVGLLWLAQIEASSSYFPDVVVPAVVFSAGLGLTFLPLTLGAVSRVDEGDSGLASGLLNAAQQVGGAVGLGVLATVASTVSGNYWIDNAVPVVDGQPAIDPTAPDPQVLQGWFAGLAEGYTVAFYAAAGLALLALVVASVMFHLDRSISTGQAAEPIHVG